MFSRSIIIGHAKLGKSQCVSMWGGGGGGEGVAEGYLRFDKKEGGVNNLFPNV